MKNYVFQLADSDGRPIFLEGYANNADIVRLAFPLAIDIEEFPFEVVTGYDLDFDLTKLELPT